MALKTPPPPEGTTEALGALENFLRPGDPPPTRLRIPMGQPYLSVGLRQLADGDEILRPAPAGWRFLLRSEPGQAEQAIAADVNTRAEGAPKMTGVWRGMQIQKLAQAIDELEALPEVRAQDYELRILGIPGLHIEAFWLKPEAGGPDLVVPFRALTKEIQLMRAYPADEFRQISRRMAKDHLARTQRTGE